MLGILGYAGLLVLGYAMGRLLGDGAPGSGAHSTTALRDSFLGVAIVFGPLLYLGIVFVTSFAKRQSDHLKKWGHFAHVILAAFNVAFCCDMLSDSRHQHWFAAAVAGMTSLIVALLWYRMFARLEIKAATDPGMEVRGVR